MSRNIAILLLYSLFGSSFTTPDRYSTEFARLEKLTHTALRGPIGKAYVADLTGREGCNKTRLKYLGVVHTNQGKSYKILTSFFVFSASSTCHGTSHIKVFDMKNRYIGAYYVGMPDELPDALKKNKLLYVKRSADCNLGETRSVDLSNGLPRRFFYQCSEKGGEEYIFTSEK